MITAEEREELKEILPTGFAKEISLRLNAVKVNPARAKEYNPKIIRQVLYGDQQDINVELALFRYRDEILEKRAELEHRRNKKINQ